MKGFKNNSGVNEGVESEIRADDAPRGDGGELMVKGDDAISDGVSMETLTARGSRGAEEREE